MFIKDFLKQFGNQKIILFVDMDGVIADYDVGQAKDYHKKRPLISSIKKLEKVSRMKNVEMYILSVTRMNSGIAEKHEWLDKFVPFIKKENRYILSREANDFRLSRDLKTAYIKEVKKKGTVTVFIDDDPRILDDVKINIPDVVLLKDTALVD